MPGIRSTNLLQVFLAALPGHGCSPPREAPPCLCVRACLCEIEEETGVCGVERRGFLSSLCCCKSRHLDIKIKGTRISTVSPPAHYFYSKDEAARTSLQRTDSLTLSLSLLRAMLHRKMLILGGFSCFQSNLSFLTVHSFHILTLGVYRSLPAGPPSMGGGKGVLQ